MQIKSTFDRSNGLVEVVIAETCLFCSGSSVSSSALAGSPRKSRPSLSISSSMKTGSLVSTRFRFWMIWPGSAPM